MTTARRLAPPPPASRTRAVERCPLPTVEEHAAVVALELTPLRARTARLLPRVDAGARALRDEADTRRGVGDRNDRLDTAERRAADRLDVSARELDAAADELRWLASLGP